MTTSLDAVNSGTSSSLITADSSQRGNPDTLDSTAKEFEKMFVDLMVKTMHQASSLEEKSNAEDTYRSLLDDEYSRAVVESTNFGIRDMIKDQQTLFANQVKIGSAK